MIELKLIDDRMPLAIKPTRAPLSPKLRFQVLRRDGFTCQYCGRTGSDRELEIDHIIPVSKGGTNDIGNLQTACRECNRGKVAEEILGKPSEIKTVENTVIKEVPAVQNKPVTHIINFIRQNPSPQQVEEFIEQEARRRIAEQKKCEEPIILKDNKQHKGLKMKCKRPDCNTEWEYKGNKKYPAMVCCPCCMNKTKLPKEEAK